ncbi:defensin-A4-like [Melitaea cinxia]|uniref:defensin-A4-like n=1 Tax=Melitaea cinxia TaxID=113334 RepID=UPI001E2704B8|nr:defensin-A4-like [Melitaea cinxia]
MAIKTIYFLFALLAALLMVQTISCVEENEQYGDLSGDQSDLLFIENPDTEPVVISPAQALLDSPTRNRVCNSATCQRVCRSLNFRYGRCNRNRVCVCSNS